MVFGIHDYRCPFARFRLKMISKMIANGRFWMGDCLLDRGVVCGGGKEGLFWGRGYDACHTQVEKVPKATSTIRSGFSSDGHRRRFQGGGRGVSDNPGRETMAD